ncbi:uncharacterized protein Slp1p [Trichomonascus vanleenenianus]|uniref:Slp1p n=1 Tax=Trichomonascus vanleenenianus TaxID=2268995 RepID=UPI003EC9ED7E
MKCLLAWALVAAQAVVGALESQCPPTGVLDRALGSSPVRIIYTTVSAQSTGYPASPVVAAEPPNGLEPYHEILDVGLEDTFFPSFEEWRKQNLEKSGQSEDFEPREAPDLAPESEDEHYVDQQPGKVYKERFNYASFDCAATIMKTNRDTKGASNILSENKDTYMLNECTAENKFVILELCNDILVDTVSIANYEFFSSMFRNIRISVADRFPPSKDGWKVLGEFEAVGVRDIQHFHIKNPLIWARYLQIEFLSHWGHEFYCPVSVVRVHGTTMMDEYKSEEKTKHRPRRAQSAAEPSANTNTNNTASKPTTIVPNKVNVNGQKNQSCIVGKKNDSEAIPTTEEACNPAPSESEQPASSPDMTPNETTDMLYSSVSFVKEVSPLVFNESCSWNEYIHIEPRGNYTVPGEEEEPYAFEQKTQDSVYQTIMKRLRLLESNATLSLQYIEEQSQNLRELLYKIEKKQTLRIELFFGQFNNTVTEQLNLIQHQYSAIMMDAISRMETQRRKADQDVLALSSRLTLLADELMYQKKVGVAQALILLVILLFVITTRGAVSGEGYALDRTSIAQRLGLASPTSPYFTATPHRVFVSRSVEEVDHPFMHSDSELNEGMSSPDPEDDIDYRRMSMPVYDDDYYEKESYPTPDSE